MVAPHYLLLVLVGLSAFGWGLSATHRRPSPRNLLPSLLTIAGMALMMVGFLLSILPRFFLE